MWGCQLSNITSIRKRWRAAICFVLVLSLGIHWRTLVRDETPIAHFVQRTQLALYNCFLYAWTSCSSGCYWWQQWRWYWDCCFRWKDWEGNASSSFQSRFHMTNQVLGSSLMYILQLNPWLYRSQLHMFLICSHRQTYNLGIIQLHFTRVFTKIASDMLILLVQS